MRKRLFFPWCGWCLLILFSLAGTAAAQIRHEVFLANTEHELNVYRIFGEESGKTIMIIGGIQGDEPGGYLTADLYADTHLKKGNLIVVPRANLYSILLNSRNGLTGDMNRKFARENDQVTHLEEEIVSILKHLIAESDCLLNLHEGSGYYSPTWINDTENPGRYGQSIIFDTDTYRVPDSDQVVELGSLARRVIARVNQQISNPRYKFRANNHDTLAPDSKHKEQRKSATFYALTRAHIPAFGVETSKMIKKLETKIQMQKLVINTFMEEMGIVLDSPGLVLDQPRLNYLLVKVNDSHPVALANGATLFITLGDEITVTDIIANYPRGVIADVENMGSKNDTNIPFRVCKPTRITIRKDAEECGWVWVVPKEETERASTSLPRPTVDQLKAEQLLVRAGDRLQTLTEGEVLSMPRGERLTLQGIRTNIPSLDEEVFVNLKGFAPPKSVNDGNDLGYTVYTGRDLWTRYSKNKEGRLYPIEVTHKDKKIGRFWLELTD